MGKMQLFKYKQHGFNIFALNGAEICENLKMKLKID